MRNKVALLLLVAMLLSCSFVFANGANEEYPNKTIEIVCPSGSGGGQDTLCRLIAPMLEKELGTTFRVTNVNGGAHVKGIIYSNSAPADGYTIHCESPSGIIADIFQKMDFKFTEEFVPVCRMQIENGVLWTAKNGRFKTFQEAIAYAKDHPGEVSITIASPGGVDDAGIGLLQKVAGVEFAVVPADSGGERMASVIAGHVDFLYEELSAVGDMMDSGTIVPALLFGKQRVNTPEFKDVPCTDELGYYGLEGVGTWRGFAVKKGTPQDIIDKLEAAFKVVFESEEYQKYAHENSLDLVSGWQSEEEFGELWESTYEDFSKTFKELGRI